MSHTWRLRPDLKLPIVWFRRALCHHYSIQTVIWTATEPKGRRGDLSPAAVHGGKRRDLKSWVFLSCSLLNSVRFWIRRFIGQIQHVHTAVWILASPTTTRLQPMSQASVQKHTQLFEPFKGYKTSIWSKMAPTRPTFKTLTEVWVSSRPCFTFADFTLVVSHSLCTKTDRFFMQEVKQAQVLYHMEGWWFDLSRVPVCVPKYPWARCWTVIGQCSHQSVNVR